MPSARRLAQHERLLQPVAGNAELVRYGQLRPAHVCTQLFERPLALGLPRPEHQGNRLEETHGNHSPDNPNPEHGDSALDDEGASLLHSDMSRRYQMLAYRLALERMGAARSCPAKGTASTTRRPRTSFRWSRPSSTAIGGTTPISSRGIWRGISTGTATCASRDA